MVSSLFPSSVNKSAALRLLPFATRIEHLRQMKNGAIQVTYIVCGRRCSTFLSRKAFERDFQEFRQQGASTGKVREWRHSYKSHFDCHSEGSPQHYTTKKLCGIVSCNCKDYQKQEVELGSRASCKHVIATLAHINSKNLEHLEKSLEQSAEEARLSIFPF